MQDGIHFPALCAIFLLYFPQAFILSVYHLKMNPHELGIISGLFSLGYIFILYFFSSTFVPFYSHCDYPGTSYLQDKTTSNFLLAFGIWLCCSCFSLPFGASCKSRAVNPGLGTSSPRSELPGSAASRMECAPGSVCGSLKEKHLDSLNC